jgi:hypothetical protein
MIVYLILVLYASIYFYATLIRMNSSPFRYLVFIGIGVAIAFSFFYLFVPSDPSNQPPVPQDPNEQQPIGNQTANCGILSCHGLDIECGADVPEMCTMEYRLGDFCRQLADCQVVKGTCQFVENSYFMNCKSCVHDCEVLNENDPAKAFECESQCREQFESVL